MDVTIHRFNGVETSVMNKAIVPALVVLPRIPNVICCPLMSVCIPTPFVKVRTATISPLVIAAESPLDKVREVLLLLRP